MNPKKRKNMFFLDGQKGLEKAEGTVNPKSQIEIVCLGIVDNYL